MGLGCLGVALAGGVCRVLVAFFLQAGGEFLDDLDFEEVAQVCEAAWGDEEVLDAAGGVGCVFFLGRGGGAGGDGKGKGGCGEEFGSRDV